MGTGMDTGRHGHVQGIDTDGHTWIRTRTQTWTWTDTDTDMETDMDIH